MLSIHELRRVLEERFHTKDKSALTLTLMSFGFKHGSPREADIVMDVRFLQNPYWVAELKPLTGRDKAIHQQHDIDSLSVGGVSVLVLRHDTAAAAAEGTKSLFCH